MDGRSVRPSHPSAFGDAGVHPATRRGRDDETLEMLRQVFQTDNPLTFAVPGTGSAGMEACLANLIEPVDRTVVVVNGYFGERLCEMAVRHGAELRRVEVPWGRAVDPAAVEAALAAARTKLVAAGHAETSTGVRQAVEPLAAACRRHGPCWWWMRSRPWRPAPCPWMPGMPTPCTRAPRKA